MKKILFLYLILLSKSILAQTGGYNSLSLSTGISAVNSKYITVMLQRAGDNKFHTGMMYEALFYSNYNNKKIDISGKDTYQGLGLYLSSTLSSTRNYDAQIYFGAAASTNFSRMIYYPFFGLSQSFFLSPGSQLFISEKTMYLLNLEGKNWQPTVSVGFKILL